ncbi:histidine--tRNA ligase [Candidatus Saccharibacteria bacterium]|nr:histidine--tRNA ligase [Candidatus Saccharibacteria bacterium]
MKLSTQPYKGARDFYPEDKRRQDYMFGVIRSVVESFGYEEYDAPLIEPLDIYKAKTGDEIVNEQVYSFMDRGGREVAIRPEMTPSVSRMVAAKRQELAYPLRWYSIPNLWRYERPQRGRLREHWQLNVDIFGDPGLSADVEIIQIADLIMKAFGAKQSQYEIRVNSRKLVDAILTNLGMDEADKNLFLKISDRWEKFKSKEERLDYIDAVLEKSGYGDKKKQDFMDKIAKREEAFNKAFESEFAENLRDVMVLLNRSNVEVKYSPYLARGFDYYTDIVFEVFDTDPENNRSMFGGGRYDGLVGLFGVEPVPTVGFGMGDVTLANFLETNELFPRLKTKTDLAVVLIGDVYELSLPILQKMREEGVNVSIDPTDRKIDKKLKSVDKQGIRYVMFIGENELKEGVFPVKDLVTGDETKQSIERIISSIEDYRKED